MAVGIGETWQNDGPEDTCFGCGHQNERGLKLVFTRTGERTVEAEYEVASHWCGPPDIVHGGIQAALLDEVTGAAAACGFDDGAPVVTADLHLRFRRPCPAGKPLRIQAEIQRIEGHDAFVTGEIRDADGEVLTRAEARWRRLPA